MRKYLITGLLLMESFFVPLAFSQQQQFKNVNERRKALYQYACDFGYSRDFKNIYKPELLKRFFEAFPSDFETFYGLINRRYHGGIIYGLSAKAIKNYYESPPDGDIDETDGIWLREVDDNHLTWVKNLARYANPWSSFQPRVQFVDDVVETLRELEKKEDPTSVVDKGFWYDMYYGDPYIQPDIYDTIEEAGVVPTEVLYEKMIAVAIGGLPVEEYGIAAYYDSRRTGLTIEGLKDYIKRALCVNFPLMIELLTKRSDTEILSFFYFLYGGRFYRLPTMEESYVEEDLPHQTLNIEHELHIQHALFVYEELQALNPRLADLLNEVTRYIVASHSDTPILREHVIRDYKKIGFGRGDHVCAIINHLTNVQDKYGATPLHKAASNANIVKRLENGAKLYLKDKEGRTALDIAVLYSNNDIAYYLKELSVHEGK